MSRAQGRPSGALMKVTRFIRKNDTAESIDVAQLSKLSSVLNGLEHGACAMRRRARQLMRAVRSGTYKVDPLKLSRRIIGDTLSSA
jgi:anti-sigma28 factor (negative regulator of flagellin synthesis)